MLEEDRIRAILDELESSASEDDAVILGRFLGGDGEALKIAANQAGFVLLAADLLRVAGFADPDAAEIRPSRLFGKKSEFFIVELELQEQPVIVPDPPSSTRDKVVGALIGIGCLAVVALILIGIVTVLGWIT